MAYIIRNNVKYAGGSGSGGNNDLVNIIYPIGSIYMSVNNVSPTTLFGGTWEQIKDTFLLSAGDTYSGGSTGGEASHTLTVDEMPSHDHTAHEVLWLNPTSDGNNGYAALRSATRSTMSPDGYSYTGYVKSTGGGSAHNNMPPYLTVFVWKRVS